MILKEQVIRMQNLMGIVKEDKAYFDLLNDEIASLNLLAIALFNNGPTFCAAT